MSIRIGIPLPDASVDAAWISTVIHHVPDLGADWYSVVDQGHVSQPSETPPNGRADITLRVASDDLVDLVEGRISFLSAFTSGKVKVDASIVDLLRLRSLL